MDPYTAVTHADQKQSDYSHLFSGDSSLCNFELAIFSLLLLRTGHRLIFVSGEIICQREVISGSSAGVWPFIVSPHQYPERQVVFQISLRKRAHAHAGRVRECSLDHPRVGDGLRAALTLPDRVLNLRKAHRHPRRCAWTHLTRHAGDGLHVVQ